MNVGDRLYVALTGATVPGTVVDTFSDRRVSVQLDTSELDGFGPACTCSFTKRHNGDWHRVSVSTGCGWKLLL